MIVGDHLARVAMVAALYETDGDPGFDEVCRRLRVAPDDPDLADLIECDGRARLRSGRAVTLDRYLDAVPGLADRLDALDAAIDMTLRGLVAGGLTDVEATDRLVAQHTAIEVPIREAAALSDAVWSTTRLRTGIAEPAPLRELPGPFGPVTDDGAHRYELLELLGEGAFGQVYLAEDRRLSDAGRAAMVSIKVLAAHAHDEHERRRLVEEATKARRIDHPNVVRVLDRGVSDRDEDFVVYELVDGGDLSRWKRRRRDVSPDDAARLVAGIARGVHAAHMAGLVHCDLKPANIMLTNEAVPKVADFGIAIRAGEDEDAPAGTGSGAPLGNRAFIAPEQFRMEPGAITVPSDLYALGGILYWLLTDELPNGDTADRIAATHDPVHGRREAPAPRAVRRAIDRDLDAICRRAMAPAPHERYASAAALADDLEAWRRHEPIHWTRPSGARRLDLWVRRKPALATATAVIVLLAIAAGFVTTRVMVANMRLDVEGSGRRWAMNYVENSVRKIKQRQKDGLETEVFPMLWLFEYYYGPTVMSTEIDWDELWDVRVETTRQLVEKLRAQGDGDHLEAILWESILAFWLVHDADYAEAEPLLERNIAAWRAHLPASDPWLRHLEGLRACAVVQRHAAEGAAAAGAVTTDSSSDSSGASPELAGALATLETLEAELARTRADTPIHAVVRSALERGRGLGR